MDGSRGDRFRLDAGALTWLESPADPLIRVNIPSLGDPPADWIDPPECPLATSDHHCEPCWTHTDLGPASLGRYQAGAAFGAAFAVGDYNGDGYPDVAIGAPGEDDEVSMTADVGRVYVYLGSSRGFQPWTVLENPAPEADARFGANLLRIDLDDTDDFDDLVVAYGGSVADTPIYVYEGHAEADDLDMPTAYALSTLDTVDMREDSDSELGFALAAGDFDDDGDEDLAVGAPNYYDESADENPGAVFRLINASGTLGAGGRVLGDANKDRFGHSLAAGDVDGMGDYLVVGAPLAGAVEVYDGTTLEDTLMSGFTLAEFGSSLLIADVLSGGASEILIGGIGADFVEIDGTSTVDLGLMTTPEQVRPLAAGDLNEDGFDDLVLVHIPASGDHEVELFESNAGMAPTAWFELDWMGRASGDDLGSTAAIVDLDGDELVDLVVGAPALDGGDVHTFVPASWSGALAPTQTVDQETAITACDECTVFEQPDGSLCLDESEDYICAFGVCELRGCGDGYRQTGEEPGFSWTRESCDDGNQQLGDACSLSCATRLLLVASREDGNDYPSRRPPSVAEDGAHDLLFVFIAENGEDAVLQAQRANYGGDLFPIEPDPEPPDGGWGFDGGEPMVMEIPGYGAGPTEELILGVLPGAGWDAQANVAGLPDGGWIVVWTTHAEEDAGTGIAMRVVHADGSLGPTLVANQTVIGEQYEPRIAMLKDEVVVVWTDASAADGPLGRTVIKARRFDFEGRPLEDEWLVSDPSVTASQAALASNGEMFLVAYVEHPEDPFAHSEVLAQRFGAASPDTEPFTVSDMDGAEPSVAVLDGSTFVAAWTERGGADFPGEIQSRTIPTSGAPPTLGSIVDHGVDELAEGAPSIAPYGDGYLVAWEQGGHRRQLDFDYTSMSIAEEVELLNTLIDGGLQGDVTVYTTFRGTWFAWSDAHRFGTGAQRSFVAFLLPGS